MAEQFLVFGHDLFHNCHYKCSYFWRDYHDMVKQYWIDSYRMRFQFTDAESKRQILNGSPLLPFMNQSIFAHPMECVLFYFNTLVMVECGESAHIFASADTIYAYKTLNLCSIEEERVVLAVVNMVVVVSARGGMTSKCLIKPSTEGFLTHAKKICEEESNFVHVFDDQETISISPVEEWEVTLPRIKGWNVAVG